MMAVSRFVSESLCGCGAPKNSSTNGFFIASCGVLIERDHAHYGRLGNTDVKSVALIMACFITVMKLMERE